MYWIDIETTGLIKNTGRLLKLEYKKTTEREV